MQKGFLNWARKYHKWPALFLSLFLLCFSISGIILNHRELFSGTDIGRKYLPKAYRLKNWNLASVRSSVSLNDSTVLIFGNSGIWKTDQNFTKFTDFNKGLPGGMDNRKVRSVIRTNSGQLLAGTFFGLYEYSFTTDKWQKVQLPSGSERIQDILSAGRRIVVITRSEIFSFNDIPGLSDPEIVHLKPPAGYDQKMNLFRFLWITHSGEIAGIAGRLFLDFLAVIIIFLVVTGLIVFFAPKISRAFSLRAGSLPKMRHRNLKLHNKAGAWFFVFLILVPFTGMFLRPPFLIAIADVRIPVISFGSPVNHNPWNDKLRSAAWWSSAERFIISTSEGFFHCDSLFSDEPLGFQDQPPVSVMGINVFEADADGTFLAGSFEGLYRWDPGTGNVVNALKNENPIGRNGRGGSSVNLVSGLLHYKGGKIVLDYDLGALPADGKQMPPMPGIIIGNSPMPLWNLAQEVHTGRIYQPLFGMFYILIVPLAGIFTILIFVTGYIRWRKIYRSADDKKRPVLHSEHESQEG